jgi:hypothetical protein
MKSLDGFTIQITLSNPEEDETSSTPPLEIETQLMLRSKSPESSRLAMAAEHQFGITFDPGSVFQLVMIYHKRPKRNRLEINRFFNRAQSDSQFRSVLDNASSEDQVMFKRLGHTVLCHTLKYLLKTRLITSHDRVDVSPSGERIIDTQGSDESGLFRYYASLGFQPRKNGEMKSTVRKMFRVCKSIPSHRQWFQLNVIDAQTHLPQPTRRTRRGGHRPSLRLLIVS